MLFRGMFVFQFFKLELLFLPRCKNRVLRWIAYPFALNSSSSTCIFCKWGVPPRVSQALPRLQGSQSACSREKLPRLVSSFLFLRVNGGWHFPVEQLKCECVPHAGGMLSPRTNLPLPRGVEKEAFTLELSENEGKCG
jgi:hypothetical protein